MTRVLIVTGLLLASGATHALAQPIERGYLQAVGGFSFGTERAGLLGGGIGFALSDRVHLVVEAGRMRDVLPRSIRRDVDAVVAELSAGLGTPMRADVKVPATYWASGVRVHPASDAGLQPYATFTFGAARLSADIALIVDGARIAMEDDIEDEAGLVSATEPLMGIGAGLEVPIARRIAAEVGYQYNRIFTSDPAVNTNRAFAAVKVKF